MGSERRVRQSHRSDARRRAAAGRAPPAGSGPPRATRARDRRRGRWRTLDACAVGCRIPATRRMRPRIRGAVCWCWSRNIGIVRSLASGALTEHQGPSLNPHPEALDVTAVARGYARLTVGFRPQQPVGRLPELETARGVLDDLQDGSAGCLVVEGEPGIGKTRLLSELRRPGRGAGLPRARRLGGGVRARPAVRRLGRRARRLRRLAGPRRRDDRAGSCAPGRRAAVAAARARPRRLATSATGRTARVRALLELLASDKPLVLVLDDLHWSDAASVELIARAAAPPRRGARAAGARLPLGQGAREARRGARGARGRPIIELGPLSEADCCAAGRRAPRTRAPARGDLRAERRQPVLHAAAGAGVARLPARSSSGDRLALDAGVPRVVAAALVEELDGAERRRPALLLTPAAIAGDPFEPDLAYAIAELAPRTGVAALDELLDARLLHADRRPAAVRVPAPARAPRRLRVERRAAGGSRRTPGPAQAAGGPGRVGRRRAPTTSSSPRVRGDAAAIELLLEAGDANAPRAPAGAARWYAAALRLIPDEDRPARLRTLIAPRRRCCASTGDLDALLGRAARGDRPRPRRRRRPRVRLTSACAACENFLGRHEPAERRLAAALDALPRPGLPRGGRPCCWTWPRARSSRSTSSGCATWPGAGSPPLGRSDEPALVAHGGGRARPRLRARRPGRRGSGRAPPRPPRCSTRSPTTRSRRSSTASTGSPGPST